MQLTLLTNNRNRCNVNAFVEKHMQFPHCTVLNVNMENLIKFVLWLLLYLDGKALHENVVLLDLCQLFVITHIFEAYAITFYSNHS